MRIQFSVDGGFAVFPGLARPVTIDVDSLPAAAATAVRAAVAKADFFARVEPADAAGGAADMRTYSVTVDDGSGRNRTLRIPESDPDHDLAALVTVLEAHRRDALKN